MSSYAQAYSRPKGASMFERFTDRSRKVLVLAQEEARKLGHGFLATEHILLGLIIEEDGVAGQVLAGLGITYDKVLAAISEPSAPTDSVPEPPKGSPPFTPRAKKVLELSLREALQLGQSYIGTEHLLLGIVREGEGVAAQTLQRLSPSIEGVRSAVLDKMSQYPQSTRVRSKSTAPAVGPPHRITLPALSNAQARALQDWIFVEGIGRPDHPIYPIATAIDRALNE
jgi:ATP-dependent Clp protease ATP-binding subunit ClpC